MPVRILIAADHAIIRQGLKMIIESISDMVVVGEARDGRDALVQAEALRLDVIIMDIAMPEMNGIEATRITMSKIHRVTYVTQRNGVS